MINLISQFLLAQNCREELKLMTTPSSIKELKIGLVGAHTESLNQALEKRGYRTTLLPTTHYPKSKLIKDVDIILGAYFHSAWPWFVKGKIKRKKTICHWVGSDSVLASLDLKRKVQTKIFTKFIDINIAVSSRIKDELAEKGIESIELFHGSDIQPEELPMPKRIGALIYFIEGREKLYGVDRAVEISENLDYVDFYFVGHFNPEKYNKKYKKDNLHFLGFVDLNELWPKISAVIRMTQHDGFPKIIVEAYSKGRYVIHNYPLPGVILCETNEDVVYELIKIQNENVLNKEGIKLFKEQFNYDIFLKRFEEICLSLYEKKKK
jgi:hypothetical protein